MKTTFSPFYLVITDSTITLKHLQNRVRNILYTKITWERWRNDRPISQCRNCQTWGHAASNCHQPPRYLKCAAGHRTMDCTLPDEAQPKCTNCGVPHTAASNECCLSIPHLPDGKTARGKRQPDTCPHPNSQRLE